MSAGETEANLALLNETFKLPCSPDLIQRSVRGTAKGTLEQADPGLLEQESKRRRIEPEQAFDESSLPEIPEIQLC